MEEALDKSVLIEQLKSLKEEKIEKQAQSAALDREREEREKIQNTKENGEER